ncbi:hypothetical protein INR49_024293, partial [Caranx melampygus]
MVFLLPVTLSICPRGPGTLNKDSGQTRHAEHQRAVKIDASIGYLTGTLIKNGKNIIPLQIQPQLSSDDITEEQKWFHHLIKARSGVLLIQASNV